MKKLKNINYTTLDFDSFPTIKKHPIYRSTKDAWGNSFFLQKKGEEFILTSAGDDYEAGTADDINIIPPAS